MQNTFQRIIYSKNQPLEEPRSEVQGKTRRDRNVLVWGNSNSRRNIGSQVNYFDPNVAREVLAKFICGVDFLIGFDEHPSFQKYMKTFIEIQLGVI